MLQNNTMRKDIKIIFEKKKIIQQPFLMKKLWCCYLASSTPNKFISL